MRRGAVLVAAACVVLPLGACGSADGGGARSGGALPTASAASSASPTPTTSGVADVALGEAAEVPAQGTPGAILRLTVTDIAVATTCPGRGEPVQAPRHAYFVVLDVRAAYDPAADAGSAPHYLPTAVDRLRVADRDGVVQEVSTTDASWACFEPADLLPPFVDAGSVVTGTVVLDSETEHGWVVLEGPPVLRWAF